MTTQDTYYKFWGLQVDMGNKPHNKVIWGTQLAKHVFNNMFSGGIAKKMRFWIDGKLTDKTQETTEEFYNKYITLNNKRIALGVKELEEKLGLKKDENELYEIDNPKELIKSLKEEAIKRESPDNVINAIDYVATTGIDTLPNREKLEQILMAMAKSTAVSQKTYGSPMVQAASTFLEKNGIRKTTTINGKTYFTSNDLDFYKPEFNKKGELIRVKSMQIMIPSRYKGIIDPGTVVDKRLLKALGFRIPTQGLNSIESMEIAGFIPEGMGDTIILPTEIVVKAGSDFDIDKLNIFLPNFFINRQDKPIYIDGTVNYSEYEEMVSDATLDEGKMLTEVQYEKAQVENELKETMDAIVTSPDNVKQLLIANTSIPLQTAAKYIEYLDELRNKTFKGTFAHYIRYIETIKEPTSYNKIIETKYLLETSTKFLTAQSAVGVTANYSTFHTLAQTNGLYINDEYTTIEYKKPVIKSTKININHNSNDDGKISISNTESIDNNSIVQELSMWINAAVDAATDPFMAVLNANMQTLNGILYLSMAGCSRKTISLFMHQPIILKYIKNQDNYTSFVADISDNKKYKDGIISITSSQFKGEKIKKIDDTIVLTDEMLENEILNGGTQLQQQMLYDFIRYQDTGKIINNGIQGTTYDTKAGGKNLSELKYRLGLTQQVLNDGVIGNYNKLLDDGFISPYYKAVKDIKEMLSEYTPLMKNENFNTLFDEFINRYLQPDVNFKTEDIEKNINAFKQDFITYLILSKPNSKTGRRLVDERNRLFKGKNDIAQRTIHMKNKYPRNTLLDNLLPIFSQKTTKEAIDNIKMYVTKLDNVESNQLTQDWTELFEGGPEDAAYANDLMKMVLLQSGLQNSPMNFISFIPAKYYNLLTTNILSMLNKEDDSFADFSLEFEIHNQYNKTIVPMTSPKVGFLTYIKRISEWKHGVRVGKTRNQLMDAETETVITIEDGPIRDFKNNSTIQAYGGMKIDDVSTYDDTTIKEVIKNESKSNELDFTEKEIKKGEEAKVEC